MRISITLPRMGLWYRGGCFGIRLRCRVGRGWAVPPKDGKVATERELDDYGIGDAFARIVGAKLVAHPAKFDTDARVQPRIPGFVFAEHFQRNGVFLLSLIHISEPTR